jgi:cobalt-precorrin 5A hydrolase
MGLDQAMIVAGIGCKRGTAAPEIEAAIYAALARAGLALTKLAAIATSADKGAEPGIAAAAAKLGLRIVPIEELELKAAGGRVTTRSERVLALTGVPSVAEAAALAAAGPSAQLVATRLVVGAATCALASSDNRP